jgi:hypothetical protein
MNVRLGKLSTGSSTGTLRRRYRHKGLVALAAVVLGGIATPFAVAYWTSSGSGAGAASAGTLATVAIDSVTAGNGLRPNGPEVNVTVHIMNANDYAVVIDSVTAGTIHSSKSGCDGAGTGVSLDLSSLTGSLPSGPSTFTASASMDDTSVSACQGATFSAVLTLAVHK